MRPAPADFWARAVQAASDVPATGAERASWLTRNMTELALMLDVAHAPVDLLDAAVRGHDLELTHRRYADRLRGLRERRGPVPDWYPHGCDTAPAVPSVRRDDLDAARAVLAFAEQLHDSAPSNGEPTASGLGGRAQAAVAARADWRPLPTPPTPHTFTEVDIPPELMWRAWMVLPELGTTRVVNTQQITATDMDIWVGVHDGCHLDHMACFDTTVISPIEFGRGLLAAEALAMASELLAAADALAAGDLTTQTTVRAELIERVGRVLPAAAIDRGPCADLAARLGVTAEREFPSLPTVARAYVAGPVRLIGTNFVDPLVPEVVSRKFAQRWAQAEREHPAVTTMGKDARQWHDRHKTAP